MITYFLKINNLTDYGFTHGNTDPEIVSASLIRCQDVYIEPLLGSPLYRRVKDAIVADNVTGALQTLLNDYIRPLLTVHVEKKVSIHVHSQIRNKGTGGSNDANFQNDSITGVKFLHAELDRDIQFYTTKLVGYLKDNVAAFPEYKQVTGNAEDVQQRTKYKGSITFIGKNYNR
jgi:hypothetical protein